jgi:hypothetical protein
LFVVGETVMDPGGWEALALVATWSDVGGVKSAGSATS